MNKKRVGVSVAIATSFIVLMSAFIGSYYTGLATTHFLNGLNVNNDYHEIEEFELITTGRPNSSDIMNSALAKHLSELVFQAICNISLYPDLNNTMENLENLTEEDIEHFTQKYLSELLGLNQIENSTDIPLIQLTDNIIVRFKLTGSPYKLEIIDQEGTLVESVVGTTHSSEEVELNIDPSRYLSDRIYAVKLISTANPDPVTNSKTLYFVTTKEQAVLLTPLVTKNKEKDPKIQFFLFEDEYFSEEGLQFLEQNPNNIEDKFIDVHSYQNSTWEYYTTVKTNKSEIEEVILSDATPSMVIEDPMPIYNFSWEPKMLVYISNLSFAGDDIYTPASMISTIYDSPYNKVVESEFISWLLELNKTSIESDSTYDENFDNEIDENIDNNNQMDEINSNFMDLDSANIELDVNATQLMEYVNLEIEGTASENNTPIINEEMNFYIEINSSWSYLGNCKTNQLGKAYFHNFLDLPSGDYPIKAELTKNNKTFYNCSSFSINIPKGLVFSDSIGHANTKFVDVINSDPILVNYSDIAEYKANITSIFGTPFENVNVTFIAFNHTEDYPKNAKKFPKQEDHFVSFWFYLYWYSDKEHKCQRHFIDISNPHFDQIRNSCWAHVIGSSMTDERGIAILNHSTYLYPGLNHLAVVVDFATSFPDCLKEQLDVENVWLYRIFHYHINVSQEESLMSPIDLEVRYSDQSDIAIRLTDNEGEPHISPETIFVPYDSYHEPIFESKLVSFYLFLNENWVHIGDDLTDESGTATISYTTWLAPGEYELKVEFLGDSLYTPSEGIYNLIVKKEYIRFSNLDFTPRYSDLEELITQLHDDEQNPVPQDLDLDKNPRSISFYLYYEDNWHDLGTTITDLQGIARLDYTPWILPDTYQIMLAFLGDNYYYPLVKYGNLTVQKEFTKLEFYEDISALQQEHPIPVTELVMRYSDSRTIVTRLSDDEGNIFIPYRFLDLLVDDLKINDDEIMTGTDGFSQFNYTTWIIPDIHDLGARFLGDEFFLPAEKNIPLKIEPEFTQLDYFGTAVPYSDWNLIMVNLTDDEGLPVPFRHIIIQAEFEEGFETIGVVITNQSGVGVLNYTALQKPGGYLMIATFFGDPYYYSCNNYGILAITKETCSMGMQEVRVMKDVPIIFNMTITEDDGPPVEGAQIDFYIFDTIWEHIPPFYSLDPIAMLYPALYEKYSSIGEIINLEIYLQPLPLPYPIGYWVGQVYVELWMYAGTNYSSDTGVTTLEWEPTVELEEGTYEIKAVYKGSEYYFACNGTAHLSILPKEVYISTLGYWIDRNYHVEITILDTDGNPVPNFDLTVFIFNGDTYSFSVTTNENGKAIINLGEPTPGNYTIRFAIVGIEYPTNNSLVIYLSKLTDLSLAEQINTWIILSSTIFIELWTTITAFVLAAAGIIGLVGFMAYLEHGNQFTGIPGALWATIWAGIAISASIADFLYYNTYDQAGLLLWQLLVVHYHETGKVIGVLGEALRWLWLYDNPAFTAIIFYVLSEAFKNADTDSVGLIVLGPMYRDVLKAYFACNPNDIAKLKFVYLGYYGSFQDTGMFSIVDFGVAVEPPSPIQYFMIPSYTLDFFSMFFLLSVTDGVNDITIHLVLEQTLQQIPWSIALVFTGVLAGYYPIFSSVKLLGAYFVLVGSMTALFLAMFCLSPKFQNW
ncbi:MAG: hypothetical protein ACTSRG_17085 [Candidatus Helarchaeota archaeon]